MAVTEGNSQAAPSVRLSRPPCGWLALAGEAQWLVPVLAAVPGAAATAAFEVATLVAQLAPQWPARGVQAASSPKKQDLEAASGTPQIRIVPIF